MKPITLVTGATGLVGNNVVRLLLAQGHAVRVLMRSGSNGKALDGLGVQKYVGDVCDVASLTQACDGVRRVVHAAGHVHIGWRGERLHQTVNVEGTHNVAAAALAANAKLVHVSSIDALGTKTRDDPVSETSLGQTLVACPYITSKQAAEQMVLEQVQRGLKAVIVNPGFMLGPYDWKPSSGRMLLEVARGWALLAPPGTNSYCDVRDVAAGIVATLERGRCGERYILAGQTLNYTEAWKLFARITGGRPPLKTARTFTLRMIGRAGDVHARLTGRESDVNSATVAMSLLPKNYSSAKAAAELDYRTRDVESSARDAWQWLCKNGYAIQKSAARR